MNLLRRSLCFYFFIAPFILHAQPSSFRFTNYFTQQGLSSNAAKCILKDSRGFLWVGTLDGLNEFDGHRFKIFRHNRFDSLSLPGNVINSIAEDEKGFLWIGTHDGVARMNPLDGHCEIYKHREGDTASLNADFDNRIIVDAENHVWILNGQAISHFNPSKKIEIVYKDLSEASGFSTLYEENSNSFWFAAHEGLLHFIPCENLWELFKPLPNDSKGNIINCIFIDHHKTLWCGVWGGGLCRFNRDSKTFDSFKWNLSPVNPSVVNIVLSITEITDQKQSLLMVGTGEGLLVLNNDSFPRTLQHAAFITHDAVNTESIAGNFINMIAEDDQHIIWLATDNGISSIIPSQQVFKVKDYRVKGQITKIFPVSNKFHITSWYGNGLTVCDKDMNVQKEFFHLPPSGASVDNGQVSDVIKDHEGNFWFATFNGLVRSDSSLQKFEVFTHDANDSSSITSNRITCLLEDDQHRIWVGAYNGGLNRLDEKTHTFIHFHHHDGNQSSLSHDLVWLLRKDHSGRIWIGTNNGLCYYNEPANNFINLSSSQIMGPTIHDIYEDTYNVIWIGTNKGLNKLNPSTMHTEFFSTEDGLGNYDVQGIIGDNEHNLWLGTGAGISRFNTTKNFFTNYSTKNGLPDEGFFSVFYKDEAGTIWDGGNSKFLIFNPALLNLPVAAPPVYITEMKIENAIANAAALVSMIPLNLKYDQNVIAFSFTAPEFLAPDDLHYLVKLDGADHEWSDIGNRNSATYASLEPGSYTFHVKVKNADGAVSEKEAMMNFIIAPPFWKTAWFISLVVVALATIFFFAVRYVTTRKLRERLLILEKEKAIEQERTRISRDMHDDLGSGLTKIAILSEVTQRQLGQPEKAGQQLHTISDSARTLVDNLNEIIWTLNPRHDNLDSLMAYIRDYATHYFDGTDVSVTFEYPSFIPVIHLTDQQRRNIFLALKETLHNISKHAVASRISVELQTGGKELKIFIRDDGKGFDTLNPRTGGNGLRNMAARMRTIGGVYSITSVGGKGTVTTLQLTGITVT